jgi:L-amino acid N-acyltransferase YncA
VIGLRERTIEALTAGDWRAVRAIYLEGIATGDATFNTDAPSWESWDAEHHEGHRIVARLDGEVAGWAALAPVWEWREVYGGVAEVSVYVAERARRRGIGRLLLEELLAGADRAGIWTVQAGIFPENRASLALHAACGFRVVGVRERIGRLEGVWRDVLLLERRSPVVQ